jgi:hypothetical protein
VGEDIWDWGLDSSEELSLKIEGWGKKAGMLDLWRDAADNCLVSKAVDCAAS